MITIPRKTARRVALASAVSTAALMPAMAQDTALCAPLAEIAGEPEAFAAAAAAVEDRAALAAACEGVVPAEDYERLSAALLAEAAEAPADLAATTESVEEIVAPEAEEVVEEALEGIDGDAEAVAEAVEDAAEAPAEVAEAPAPEIVEAPEASEDAAATDIAEDTTAETSTAGEGDIAADTTANAETAPEPAADPAPEEVVEAPAEEAAVPETDELAAALAEEEPAAEAVAEVVAEDDVTEAVTDEILAETAEAEPISEGTEIPAEGTVAGVEIDGAVDDAAAEVAAVEAKAMEEAIAAGADPDAGVEAAQVDTMESAEAASAAPEVDTAAIEAAAAAEAAAGTPGAAPAEDPAAPVQTEVVTAPARSATEEITAPAAIADSDDDGLTNFQKALILGLGTVAVGSLLQGQGRVVADTGDRVVVQDGGELRVLKDDDALLRQADATVSTRTYDDGTTLTTVDRADGSRVITIRAASGQVLRRTVIAADGTSTVLFDDTQQADVITAEELDRARAESRQDQEVADLEAALSSAGIVDARRYSLQQVREIRAVRQLVPVVALDDITFDTGSSAIRPEQAEALRDIGTAMRGAIVANPGEVFLVEGHTDATGGAAMNLALSDRRAESVALALTEFFGVPPENMIVQGYGESALKIRTGASERENRRATVRRITPLLNGTAT